MKILFKKKLVSKPFCLAHNSLHLIYQTSSHSSVFPKFSSHNHQYLCSTANHLLMEEAHCNKSQDIIQSNQTGPFSMPRQLSTQWCFAGVSTAYSINPKCYLRETVAFNLTISKILCAFRAVLYCTVFESLYEILLINFDIFLKEYVNYWNNFIIIWRGEGNKNRIVS